MSISTATPGQCFKHLEGKRIQGTVISFANQFGFIEGRDAAYDTKHNQFFVHYSDLCALDGWKQLQAGMQVEFQLEWAFNKKTGKYKYKAVRVTAPGGGLLQTSMKPEKTNNKKNKSRKRGGRKRLQTVDENSQMRTYYYETQRRSPSPPQAMPMGPRAMAPTWHQASNTPTDHSQSAINWQPQRQYQQAPVVQQYQQPQYYQQQCYDGFYYPATNNQGAYYQQAMALNDCYLATPELLTPPSTSDQEYVESSDEEGPEVGPCFNASSKGSCLRETTELYRGGENTQVYRGPARETTQLYGA